MDIIKTDKSPGEMLNNIEASASHLLPSNPLQKNRTYFPGNKSNSAEIYELTGDEVEVSAFGITKGVVKTVIHLWYHNYYE